MDNCSVGFRHDAVGIFGNPRVRDHAMPAAPSPHPLSVAPICGELEGGGELGVLGI
jgi:hypothetical protein